MEVNVRSLAAGDISSCGTVLAGLPEWFGLKEANAAYIESLRELPAFVAESAGNILGFLALRLHGPKSAEVHVVAVAPTMRRSGVGHQLIAKAREWCSDRGVRWLRVTTRGPSTPDPFYEQTRAFFLAEGFEPLFESLTLWGPDDACLVLVQCLSAGLKSPEESR
ncbi:MAG: GNAT family N-acetyltransferase [Actinomycetota bacterium]